MNQHQNLITLRIILCPCLPCLVDICYHVCELFSLQMDRMTDRTITWLRQPWRSNYDKQCIHICICSCRPSRTLQHLWWHGYAFCVFDGNSV